MKQLSVIIIICVGIILSSCTGLGLAKDNILSGGYKLYLPKVDGTKVLVVLPNACKDFNGMEEIHNVVPIAPGYVALQVLQVNAKGEELVLTMLVDNQGPLVMSLYNTVTEELLNWRYITLDHPISITDEELESVLGLLDSQGYIPRGEEV